ncbi:MAG: ribonuclease III [Planctomycetota bacterium]|jgi:ribonuclease-3|nr:ribonuclease III [Planctomycetota bacterium]
MIPESIITIASPVDIRFPEVPGIREDVEDVPVDVIEIGAATLAAGWRNYAGEGERLSACEAILGYVFSDKSLLLNALTHSSSTSDKRLDNERLEFFGDAVLDLVIREHLFLKYPNRNEGELTEAKSAVVCRASLVKAARRINLESFLILGRGIGKRRLIPESLLADAFEAVVAAIYIDGGIAPSRNFILAHLGETAANAIELTDSANYKSVLQKILQRQRHPPPVYRVVSVDGPEHSRFFTVAAFSNDRELGRGSGANKKAAEQEAARAALGNLQMEWGGNPDGTEGRHGGG